jgi:transcriptional regulator
MDETRRRFVLQLMQPMLREFNKTLIEMRDRGQTETEIAAMLGSGLIQTQNAMMAARTTADKKLIASLS